MPQIRALLAEHPRMPASVIAERVGWTFSSSLLRERVSELRPDYLGVDPADRLSFRPGEAIQCDLWFPEPRIPVGDGQERVLPVLVMVSGFPRRIESVMLPSRQGGDLTAGMWVLLQRFGGIQKSGNRLLVRAGSTRCAAGSGRARRVDSVSNAAVTWSCTAGAVLRSRSRR